MQIDAWKWIYRNGSTIVINCTGFSSLKIISLNYWKALGPLYSSFITHTTLTINQM